jgi:peptidoglycan-associated lipoprotein
MTRMGMSRFVAVGVVMALVAAGCGKKPAPVARPMPPPVTTDTGSTPAPPPPPTPVEEPVLPAPVYFGLDSFEINAEGRTILQNTAQILQKQPTWQVTVEGHCDERGTAEYNLSLGERRAVAAKTYLVSLGVSADRLRTVSYGKEFPFDPGHDESAYAKNRRAHFVITAK